jgi:hypothetical protein
MKGNEKQKGGEKNNKKQEGDIEKYISIILKAKKPKENNIRHSKIIKNKESYLEKFEKPVIKVNFKIPP